MGNTADGPIEVWTESTDRANGELSAWPLGGALFESRNALR
jgi:hypothetical protein